MGYRVTDRLEVSVFLSGIEFYLEELNTLNYLHMGVRVQTLVPTVHMVLNDSIGQINASTMLKDSAPISIVFKTLGQERALTYNFRLFHFKTNPVGTGTLYEMDGWFDSIPFWLTTSNEAIRGTSSEAMSQIATICGLKYDGVTTNDSQLWIPQNRTYSQFSKKIASSGWQNENSYMKAVLDFDGTLRYKNMNDLGEVKANLVKGQIKSGFQPIVDSRVKGASGLNNKLTGYWDTKYNQSISTEQVFDKYSELRLVSDSRTALYNEEVRTQALRGRQSYGPIDVGNVHPNYELAKYQNTRYANLFNVGGDFLTIYPTGLNMLDRFSYTAPIAEGDFQDNVQSGNYTVTAKAIVIQGGNYGEMVEGYRHGTSLKG